MSSGTNQLTNNSGLQPKTIIIPTGFYNTGSSVVTNILQEFNEIETVEGVNEWRLLYDADGIRDLEYHLLESPHRQNTAYAIRRFKRYIDFNSNKLLNHHYERQCNGNFKRISYEYIKDISDFEYSSASHLDIRDRGELFWFVERCYSKIIRTFFSSFRPSWIRGSLMPKNNPQFAGTYNKDKFYDATKRYLSKLLKYVNPNETQYIVADQFLPPSGVDAFLNYFPSDYTLKIFIVDRDPRDLYFTCKYFLHTKSIPTNDVEIFCKWYKWTREQSKINSDANSIIRIRFENCIYEYDKTREGILEFCGIADAKCLSQYKYFDPRKSINNTQVWRRYTEHDNELEYIVEHLGNYCYRFEDKLICPDYNNGKMFDC